MKKEFFGNVITPVVGMARTCMIALSTIQGQDNYYSQLLNLRDEITGRPFFNIYKFNLACDNCIAKNLARTCKHRLDELPDYLAPAKQLQIRQILTQIGLEKAIDQETLNLSSSANDACFPSQSVEQLFSSNDFKVSTSQVKLSEVNHIWCVVDPNGGASGSDVAVSSAFQDRGGDNYIFCGGELINTATPSSAVSWILRHFHALRKLPKLEKALIFLLVENNSALLVNELAYQINNLKVVDNVLLINKFGFDTETVELNHTYAKKHHGHAIGHGVQTMDTVKEKMTELFNEGLSMSKFSIYEHFACVYSSQPDNPKFDFKRDYFTKVKTQLQAWSRCVKIVKDPMFVNKIKYTYSGKHIGPDDGAVTILLLVYYIHFHMNERSDMIKEELERRVPQIA